MRAGKSGRERFAALRSKDAIEPRFCDAGHFDGELTLMSAGRLIVTLEQLLTRHPDLNSAAVNGQLSAETSTIIEEQETLEEKRVQTIPHRELARTHRESDPRANGTEQSDTVECRDLSALIAFGDPLRETSQIVSRGSQQARTLASELEDPEVVTMKLGDRRPGLYPGSVVEHHRALIVGREMHAEYPVARPRNWRSGPKPLRGSFPERPGAQ
jgi:hypothetical protein